MTQFADILVCPRCGGPLEQLPSGLFCPRCGLVYPIREGIPVMLEEEARPVGAPKDPEAG